MLMNSAFESFTEGFTPEERIEVSLYELVLNITFSNYSEVVRELHSIIDQNDYLLSSLKKIVKTRIYRMSMKVFIMLSEEFQLNLSKSLSGKLDKLHRIFYEDDQEAFVDLLMDECPTGYTPEDFKHYINFVVEYDSIKILRFMISAGIPVEMLSNVAPRVVECGNTEIIRILELSKVDYSTALKKQDFKHIPNYCVLEWLLMNYHNDLIGSPSTKCSESLIKGQMDLHSVAILFDLPRLYLRALGDGQLADDIPELIGHENYNILRAIPEFGCKELTYSIIMKAPEAFEIILSKTSNMMLPSVYELNILELSVRVSRIEFVEKIVKKEPMLLTVRDSVKNNIFHHCALQHSPKVFKFIQMKIQEKYEEEGFLRMMSEKNIYGESPMDLLERYEQVDFLKDLDDNFKDPEDVFVVKLPFSKHNKYELDETFESFLGPIKGASSNCVLFDIVSDSETVKFINLKGVKKLGKLFTNLKDCKCLKYLDVSKITVMSNTFSGIIPNSIEGLEHWNTSNVKKMIGVFEGAKILDYFPISHWDVSNAISFKGMFSNSDIHNLEAIATWKVNPNADFTQMFSLCLELVDASPLDSWNLHETNPTVPKIFVSCRNLKIFPKWFKKEWQKGL